MNLRIVRGDLQEFVLKDWFPNIANYVFDPFAPRSRTLERYGGDGVDITGDEKIGARNISIAFNNAGTDKEQYLNALNELAGFMRKTKAPFHLVDDDRGKQTEVRLNALTDEPRDNGLVHRLGNNNMRLVSLTGFFEDMADIVYSSGTGGMAPGDSMMVDNDCAHDVFPFITITSEQQNNEITIYNDTNGALFTFSSNSVQIGSVITFDWQGKGRIELDGQELSAALVDGSGALTLVPGQNEIQYLSPNAGLIDIEIKFKKKYAF
jgi:hypothetical protein